MRHSKILEGNEIETYCARLRSCTKKLSLIIPDLKYDMAVLDNSLTFLHYGSISGQVSPFEIESARSGLPCFSSFSSLNDIKKKSEAHFDEILSQLNDKSDLNIRAHETFQKYYNSNDSDTSNHELQIRCTIDELLKESLLGYDGRSEESFLSDVRTLQDAARKADFIKNLCYLKTLDTEITKIGSDKITCNIDQNTSQWVLHASKISPYIHSTDTGNFLVRYVILAEIPNKQKSHNTINPSTYNQIIKKIREPIGTPEGILDVLLKDNQIIPQAIKIITIGPYIDPDFTDQSSAIQGIPIDKGYALIADQVTLTTEEIPNKSNLRRLLPKKTKIAPKTEVNERIIVMDKELHEKIGQQLRSTIHTIKTYPIEGKVL